MSLTVSAISEFMGRYGENEIVSQIESKAPELKLIPSEDADGERLDFFNIHGGFGNVGLVGDGGALISGGTISPVQGYQLPSAFFGRIAVPRITAKLTKGAKAGVDLLEALIDSATTRMARAIGRSVIDPRLGATDDTDLNGIADNGTGNISVDDITGFRAGDIVGLHDDSAANDPVGEYLLVNSVTPTAGSAGGVLNVTRDRHSLLGVSDPGLFTDAGNEQAAGDFFKLYSGTGATELTSLAKLATDEDVYGITVATDAPYFKGNRINESGALDDATMRNMHTTIISASGEKSGFVLASPRSVQVYVDGLTSQRQFRPGDKWDVSGGEAWTPDFDGLPVHHSTNCPNKKVYFVPKNPNVLKIRWFQRPRPESHGEVGTKGSKNYVMVSSSNYEYDQQMDALLTVRCTNRTAIGEIYGIT